MATDPASGIICTTNRIGEATVLDQSGKELNHFTLNSPVRFASLSENGADLMVLTADQRVHHLKTGQTTSSNHNPPNIATSQDEAPK